MRKTIFCGRKAKAGGCVRTSAMRTSFCGSNIAFRNLRSVESFCVRRAGRPGLYRNGDSLLDDAGQLTDLHSTGAVYGAVIPLYSVGRKAGEWNQLEISCVGRHLTVYLNGNRIHKIDVDDPAFVFSEKRPLSRVPNQGYIGLESHTNRVDFRNLRIQSSSLLPETTARCAILVIRVLQLGPECSCCDFDRRRQSVFKFRDKSGSGVGAAVVFIVFVSTFSWVDMESQSRQAPPSSWRSNPKAWAGKPNSSWTRATPGTISRRFPWKCKQDAQVIHQLEPGDFRPPAPLVEILVGPAR